MVREGRERGHVTSKRDLSHGTATRSSLVSAWFLTTAPVLQTSGQGGKRRHFVACVVAGQVRRDPARLLRVQTSQVGFDAAARGPAHRLRPELLKVFKKKPSARQLGTPQSFIGMKSTPRLTTRDHVPRRTDQCNLHTHVIANKNKSPR